MDDERIVSKLRRVGDPASPDAAFLDRMYEDLAGELGFRPARRAAPHRSQVRTLRRLTLLAAAVLMTLAALGGALIAGAFLERQRDADRTQEPLDRIQTAGVLRVVVRSDFPQVAVNGTFQGGFDADVATALADQLGVRPAIQPTNIGTLLDPATETGWDIALPSRSLTSAELARLDATNPYYAWPVYLVVESASSIGSTADLAGQRVCVVTGSAGADWLAGGSGVQTLGAVTSPPAAAVAVERPTDGDCLTLLGSGEAAAAVSASLSPTDFAARPSIRPLGEPVLLEVRRVVVPHGPGSANLIAALDRALDDLRADGSLADLSRRRFGGSDVTTPVP